MSRFPLSTHLLCLGQVWSPLGACQCLIESSCDLILTDLDVKSQCAQSQITCDSTTTRSDVAPIWSRFSASKLNSSECNGPENTLSPREATCHAPPHAPIKAAICPGTACTYVTCPPQVPPTELRPAASAAHCVRPAEHTERVDRKRARQPAGSTGGRAGARPTCSHCYALVRACSNFNRLQLCSRAAPGPLNCSPRTAIA